MNEDYDNGLEGADEGELNASSSKRISIEKADRSLSELKVWYDDGDLIVDPEWQRNYVWNRKQASKLIESFLLGIPVPVVYLAKTEEGRYQVIDGLQRLTSVFDYLENKYVLSGLDSIEKLNGKEFKDLEKQFQRELKKSTLRTIELLPSDDTNTPFMVFERLNTGGTKLNDMEIRNCLFRGELNDLIKELAKDANFKRCLNQKNISKRMGDRGLVLRFLAFYERHFTKCRKGLKPFLNDFFGTYQNAESEKLAEYERKFEHCMRACLTIFGDKGFRLKAHTSRKSKSCGKWSMPNAAIFQAIATSFAEYDLGHITRNSDSIYEEYVDLVSTDDDWIECVSRSTGTASRITYVFETWQRRLREVMKADFPNDKNRIFSKKLKKQLFDQSETCNICGQEIKLLDDAVVDHIKHYWRGGLTIPENARLVHRFCNLSRGGG